MITTYSQVHLTHKYLQHSSIIWSVWLNGSVLVYELSGYGFECRSSHFNFRYCACLEFLDIQITRECVFTLKLARGVIRTNSKMSGTDKYIRHI